MAINCDDGDATCATAHTHMDGGWMVDIGIEWARTNKKQMSLLLFNLSNSMHLIMLYFVCWLNICDKVIADRFQLTVRLQPITLVNG